MSTSHMSPYAAAAIVNARLRDVGVSKVIPAQMMYNYVKNEILKSYVADDGRTYVEHDSFNAWLEMYVSKQIAKQLANA